MTKPEHHHSKNDSVKEHHLTRKLDYHPHEKKHGAGAGNWGKQVDEDVLSEQNLRAHSETEPELNAEAKINIVTAEQFERMRANAH